MKSIKLMMLTAFTIFSVSAFAQDSTKHKMNKVVYTCTMHPEISSDKPGKCPKCGMTLVVKKDSKHSMDTSMHKMPMHKMDTTKSKKKMTK